MPVNPATKPEHLDSPIERANSLNDPSFQNSEGYYPYDLTHHEVLTPLFGKIMPSCHFITAPGDRHVLRSNTKTFLNQINGNFLNTVNEYLDTFYVPFRSVFPNNFEKFLPNPSKGSDLPNSALPIVDFTAFVRAWLMSNDYVLFDSDESLTDMNGNLMSEILASNPVEWTNFAIARMLALTSIIGRGSLLDYLGVQFDLRRTNNSGESILQSYIDMFWRRVYEAFNRQFQTTGRSYIEFAYFNPDLAENDLILSELDRWSCIDDTIVSDELSLSRFRAGIDYALQHGKLPMLFSTAGVSNFQALENAYTDVYTALLEVFYSSNADEVTEKSFSDYVSSIDSSSSPFASGRFINIGIVLAYQQVVAEYFTNNSVDNVFTAELFMQNLRSYMYPSYGALTSSEPVFDYNGISTEYDYISCAAWFYTMVNYSDNAGVIARQNNVASLLFFARNSLRYGDYFSTGRPRMLAVGDININVENGVVSAVDVTQNLLKQRYLNSVNYGGSGFLQYYASQFGVTPSDTGTRPRFISHKKNELQNKLTNNTSDNQGYQTTNLAGFTDSNMAADVFIDDIGFIIQTISYDVLPIYTSGIDSTVRLADRFDFFNPLLQNIGDQPIRLSEMLGYPSYYQLVFAYTMRNAEYKYKLSKAHGALCGNMLPGVLMKYAVVDFVKSAQDDTFDVELTISPTFIRDYPYYLDRAIPSRTGVSPGEYYHFVTSVVNTLHSARKIQAQPPILF